MIEATRSEHASGTLEPAKLEQIQSALFNEGFAVVTGLVTEETCQLLLTSILEDAEKIRAGGELTPHEKATGRGHLQLGLRRYAPYVRSDLVANPLIESVVSTVLGSGAWLGFYNGNVNCPGSEHQPVHFDRPFSWRTPEEAAEDGQSWPPPTTTLSCSVALTDITETNGPTDIFPGSHHETAVLEFKPGERPESHPNLLAKWGPPKSMTIPAGGICFRDPRMWHRGVPNEGSSVRPMMALTYHAGFAKSARGRLIRSLSDEQRTALDADVSLKLLDDGSIGDGRLVFHGSARSAFEIESIHGIERNARFVEHATVNHLVDAHMIGGARIVEN